MGKLDEGQYELVLSDAGLGSRGGGRNLLAYARIKDYRPATAVVTSAEPWSKVHGSGRSHEVSIYTENLPNLSDVQFLELKVDQ